jgi:hypothetical protein
MHESQLLLGSLLSGGSEYELPASDQDFLLRQVIALLAICAKAQDPRSQDSWFRRCRVARSVNGDATKLAALTASRKDCVVRLRSFEFSIEEAVD